MKTSLVPIILSTLCLKLQCNGEQPEIPKITCSHIQIPTTANVSITEEPEPPSEFVIPMCIKECGRSEMFSVQTNSTHFRLIWTIASKWGSRYSYQLHFCLEPLDSFPFPNANLFNIGGDLQPGVQVTVVCFYEGEHNMNINASLYSTWDQQTQQTDAPNWCTASTSFNPAKHNDLHTSPPTTKGLEIYRRSTPRRKSRDDDDSSRLTLLIVIAGCVTVLVLIVGVVFFVRKMSHKKSDNSATHSESREIEDQTDSTQMNSSSSDSSQHQLCEIRDRQKRLHIHTWLNRTPEIEEMYNRNRKQQSSHFIQQCRSESESSAYVTETDRHHETSTSPWSHNDNISCIRPSYTDYESSLQIIHPPMPKFFTDFIERLNNDDSVYSDQETLSDDSQL